MLVFGGFSSPYHKATNQHHPKVCFPELRTIITRTRRSVHGKKCQPFQIEKIEAAKFASGERENMGPTQKGKSEKHRLKSDKQKGLEPQTTIYKWLFQLDDSQSLHRKWLFHQTSIYKWLFGVPGGYVSSQEGKLLKPGHKTNEVPLPRCAKMVLMEIFHLASHDGNTSRKSNSGVPHHSSWHSYPPSFSSWCEKLLKLLNICKNLTGPTRKEFSGSFIPNIPM